VPFLTGRKLHTYTRTSQNFMEPECLFPCSQQIFLVHILKQINPVCIIPNYLSKNHPNIIHPPKSWSFWCFFPSGFLTHILYAFFPSPSCQIILSTRPPCLNHFNCTGQREQIIEILNMQFISLLRLHLSSVPCSPESMFLT
jgi:hypothetical protein